MGGGAQMPLPQVLWVGKDLHDSDATENEFDPDPQERGLRIA